MEVDGRKDEESSSSANEGQIAIFCQPCQLEGDTVPAEGFCETCNEYICLSCLKVHRKLAVSRNHVIKLKDEMPRIQTQTDSCSQLCTLHKTEIVKFYCKEHDSVGCGDCMVLHHKACTVRLVPEVSGTLGNSEELREIMQALEALKVHVSSRKYEIEVDFNATEEISIKVKEEIKTFRKEINSYLDRAEAELLKEIEQLKAKGASEINMVLEKWDAMETEIKRFQTEFSQSSNKINQLFVTAKLAQTMLKTCQKETERITSECEIISLNFEPSKHLLNLHENKPGLGKIKLTKKKYSDQRRKAIADMKACLVKTLNTKTKNDENSPYISGLAVISLDKIVLVDYYNSSLKILNVRENKITARYVTPADPWDVTVINADTVAATLMSSGQILFMNTKSGLSASHELKVKQDCRGIDHRNGMIAVSFAHPASVQVLNMKGTVFYEFTATPCTVPDYIAFSNDCKYIYVSDYKKNALFEFTTEGHLKTTMKHADIQRPRGLAVTSDGTVVVCSSGTSERVGMFVPSTGNILPLAVKDVHKPGAIVLCESQKKMYLSDLSGDCGVIVFDLE